MYKRTQTERNWRALSKANRCVNNINRLSSQNCVNKSQSIAGHHNTVTETKDTFPGISNRMCPDVSSTGESYFHPLTPRPLNFIWRFLEEYVSDLPIPTPTQPIRRSTLYQCFNSLQTLLIQSVVDIFIARYL